MTLCCMYTAGWVWPQVSAQQVLFSTSLAQCSVWCPSPRPSGGAVCVALGVMCDAVNYLGLVCVCSIKHRDRSGYTGRSFTYTRAHTHTPLNVRLEVWGGHEYMSTVSTVSHTHTCCSPLGDYITFVQFTTLNNKCTLFKKFHLFFYLFSLYMFHIGFTN